MPTSASSAARPLPLPSGEEEVANGVSDAVSVGPDKPAGPRRRKRTTTGKTRPIQTAFKLPKRVIAIGDLNGDDDALAMLLRSLGITDRRGNWAATGVHVVQMGDVVNRGGKSRAALERLKRLQREAPRKQSRLTILLGNHEAMTVLGNEAWVTADEYLEFATDDERVEFELARARKTHQLLVANSGAGRTGPITGQLRAWEEAHAPGRRRFAHAFSAEGELGAWIRTFPVAVRIGSVLFVHGGLRPRFAKMGLKGLNAAVADTWAKGPRTQLDLDVTGPLLAEDGPLWERTFALSEEHRVDAALTESLDLVSAKMMVVGHTRTDHIPGGGAGHPLLRHSGRLACVDVGIGGTGGSSAALLIEKGVVWGYRPDEKKTRLGPLLGEDTQVSRAKRRRRPSKKRA